MNTCSRLILLLLCVRLTLFAQTVTPSGTANHKTLRSFDVTNAQDKEDEKDKESEKKRDVSVQTCSTEKVNHVSCAVVFDRRYPVTLPTIQMSSGKEVFVLMNNPLPFETLSLDLTSAAALPGTEQLASLVTAIGPQLKGFVTSNVTLPPASHFTAQADAQGLLDKSTEEADAERARMDAINREFAVMHSLLNSAQVSLPDETTNAALYTHIRAVYEQLNQILAPIPKPGSDGGKDFKPPIHARQTPNPWADYTLWRRVLLCELAGGNVDSKDCIAGNELPNPQFTNVLGDISSLQAQLPATPPATPPANPIFDQTTFDALAKRVQAEIAKLTVPSDRERDNAILKELQKAENDLLARTTVLASTLSNVQKDFITYYQNILMANSALPTPRNIKHGNTEVSYSIVGTIDDPRSNRPSDTPVLYGKFLGRAVTYAVNTINNVLTSQTSVTTASAKTAITTVTVLYANPRLETSAGTIVSFVHDRTFANQTITNATGTAFQPGDIVIAQTKTDPEVVPFVAAHLRIGNEYLMPDHRRGAFYGTIWVGLNPYSTVPEYGAGPTFSWRSLMLSFLYNRAHQTSLISGESQGQVVCSPTAMAGNSPPPCSPAPPAPITHTTAINGFAIGLSIRIPTSFTSGTGGVSR